jgi:hypothetical protein
VHWSAIVVIACTRPPPAQVAAALPSATAPVSIASVEAGPRHVIPNGLVHVALVGFDDAPTVTLDVEAAAARYAEVERRLTTTYLDPGHERWFFHQFDRREMVFVIARYEPGDRIGGRYVATQRIVVARSPAAARALKVDAAMAEYETGQGGVHAGMTPAEVEAVRGKPMSVQQLGPFGAFDWTYADVTVRFLQDRVSNLFPPR